MHQLLRSSLYWGKVITLGIILGVGIQFAEAWTNPTASAPGGNVAGPLNTGIIDQIKSASLGLTGNLVIGAGGGGNSLCLNGDCRTTWPSGGATISNGSCAAGQVVQSISPTGVVTCGSDNTTIGSIVAGCFGQCTALINNPSCFQGRQCWGGATYDRLIIICPSGTKLIKQFVHIDDSEGGISATDGFCIKQ